MDLKAFEARNGARMMKLYGTDNMPRYEKLAASFEEKFGHAPEMFVSAPGRTEVIGNHTDHNKGRVMAAAVNLDTVAALSAREDTVVTLWSEGYDKPFIVDVADLTVHEEEKESTPALIRGVAARLKEFGYKIGGFDACVTSTVFKGSGLSSSAAFEVMLVEAFDALYNGECIEPKENARISQFAENVYFGKPCGLLDQTASAIGGLVAMDFKPDIADVEALKFDFDAEGYAVCVVSAGGEHGNLTADYAAIPAEMKAVAKAMGVEVLADITAEQLEAALPTLKNKVSDRSLLRAFHFVDETARVPEAIEALRNNDVAAFMKLIIASGESSWKLLQNLFVASSDNQEMPLALEMSRRILSQAGGAWRIHGGGFAGTILAFVPKTLLDEYIAKMNGVFGEGAVTVLSVRPEGVVCLK